MIRGLIAKKYPGHGVIGEELGSDRPDAEFVWVLDPIDGTKSFISAVPLFGTLIALLHEGPAGPGLHPSADLEAARGRRQSRQHAERLPGQDPKRPQDRGCDAAQSDDPIVAMSQPEAKGYLSLMHRARLSRMWGRLLRLPAHRVGLRRCDVRPPHEPLGHRRPGARHPRRSGVHHRFQGRTPYPASSTVAAATPELHAQVIAALGA